MAARIAGGALQRGPFACTLFGQGAASFIANANQRPRFHPMGLSGISVSQSPFDNVAARTALSRQAAGARVSGTKESAPTETSEPTQPAKPKQPGKPELSQEEEAAVRKLKARDTQVRAHEAADFRGVPVAAAAHSVNGSSWSVIAKTDRSEIDAQVRREGQGLEGHHHPADPGLGDRARHRRAPLRRHVRRGVWGVPEAPAERLSHPLSVIARRRLSRRRPAFSAAPSAPRAGRRRRRPTPRRWASAPCARR